MKIYITFDYEMFLGPRVGSVERCLITPTQKIMAIGEKNMVFFTFFVDILYLMKMREYVEISEKLKVDYDKIVVQIRELAAKGHSIQLHIHPQWYYSTYDVKSDKWMMDFQHYRLDSCPIEDVEVMIRDGVHTLSRLSGKPVTAFRAGGYSFPIKEQIIQLLVKYGIRKDSSVFMNKKENSKYQNYDYSNINDYSNYRFSMNICNPENDGAFEEFPISTSKFSASLFLYIRAIKGRKYAHLGKTFGDGLGVGVNLSLREKVCNKIKQILYPSVIPASLDAMKPIFIDVIKKCLIEQNGSCFVFIGHPKNVSEFGLRKLEELLIHDSGKFDIIA